MPERRVEYMPLPFIEAAERNPKRHAAVDIRNSIDRFGLGELPLIDERTGRLVAGHGRLDDIAERRRQGQAMCGCLVHTGSFAGTAGTSRR